MIMCKPFAPWALLSLVTLTGAALPAAASEAIVKKARCVACHAVDAKRVGPAYQEVAAKYKGDAAAPPRATPRSRPRS
jgi:cytochrome c